MLTYATIADYYEFRGYTTPPALTPDEEAVLVSRLRRTSAAVRSTAIENGGRYQLTHEGYPAAGTVREAFRMAACALTAGLYDREGDGLPKVATEAAFDSISMAGVTLSKSVRRSSDESSLAAAAEKLATAREAEALAYLKGAGIFGGRAPVVQ